MKTVISVWARVSTAAATALILLASGAGPAFGQRTHSPLETSSTYCDETGVGRSEGNAVIDNRDGRIESVSQLFEGPYSGRPEAAARAFLNAHKDWVGLEPDEQNLRVVRSVESPGGYHVTFERYIGNVPVYPGNLVVSFDHDLYARYYFSSLYVFKENVPTTAILSAADAERIAGDYLQPTGKPTRSGETGLVIWAGDNQEFAACWRVRQNYTEPYGDWEILVDANSGTIRRVKDRVADLNGTGYVFDPDPITTSGLPYGSPGLVDNNDANSPELQAQRFARTLNDILDFTIFGDHYYYLDGPYCEIADLESPAIAPVVQINNTVFNYTRDADPFEDCMVYYHVDQSQRRIQALGFNNVQNGPIECDAHAENNGCNAHYHFNGNYLTFGDCIDAVHPAEDGEVIWHEYGHGINAAIIPGWGGGGDDDAMGEGWSDYWAGSYGRSISAYQATRWVSWGFEPIYHGRSLQAGLHYPENAGDPDPHYGGMIWSQALYDAEVNIGSRTIMNRLGLQHQFYIGSHGSMVTAANAVLTADQNLYGGSHAAAITNAFTPRGLMAPPNNDQCPGFVIYDQPYVSSGTTAGAAHNYNNCVVGNLSQDVVYTLMAKPCPRDVVVSLCGSSYDTYLSVAYGGACPGNTEWIACNDDFCGLQSQVSFTAAANTIYYVLVHGYQLYSGNFNIAITWSDSDPIPPNDACPGALAIPALPYTHASTTCGSTNNYENCIGPASPETVYSLTLNSCQSVTASLCGSGFDTGIEVRWGGACPGAQTVACNDDHCGLSSEVTFNAAANETYYIFVDGYCTGCKGPYTLNVTSNGPFAAPNDLCPGTLITSLPYQDTGSTSCATNDFANCIGTSSNDVMYRYTPLACEMVTVSLCGSAYDCAIEVRAGGDCPGLVRVNCNDDNCGLQSELTYFAEAGVNYYYIVHGFSTWAGAYVINVTSAPGGSRPNDFCFGAYAITTLPYADVGSTSCAGNQTANCVGANSNEVFYSLQLESCYNVTASLCGSGYDTGLEVRSSGENCPGNIQVACNDDYCGFAAGSQVTFNASPNRMYWIIVHGFATNHGPFILNVTGTTCAPESLVVQKQGNNAYLDWAPVSSSGAVTYRVYRATTPDVQPIAGNLIGSTANAFFTDANVIINPQEKYFYAVTAEGPALMEILPVEAPMAAVVPDKRVDPAELEAMQAVMIPAYLDPASIGEPNPEKPQPEPGVNESGPWFGTLAPLPESQQVKR